MRRILIAIVLVALAGSAALAKDTKTTDKKKTPKAQEQTTAAGLYQYLPEEMSGAATFNQAVFTALRFTAYNSRTQRLGHSKLISNSLQADARTDSLVINAYVELTEKEKANYRGDGQFNYPAADLAPMMQEGVDFIEKLVDLYFTGLDKKYLVINLSMKGVLISSWRGGQLRVLATGE